MHVIRKSYKVEYAHQLKGAHTKGCYETIHGHSGKVELFFGSKTLDENGMVIDFGEINDLVKSFIMNLLDHALIMPNSLPTAYLNSLKKYNKKVLIVDDNPTAEFFAESLYYDIEEMLKSIFSKKSTEIYLWKVRFHETETGYAEFLED